MSSDPTDQRAMDRFLEAQATFEAVGGLTQDRRVAQVKEAWLSGQGHANIALRDRCISLGRGSRRPDMADSSLLSMSCTAYRLFELC